MELNRRHHVLIGLLCLAAVSASADDWPEWRGPNRNGVSSETNWLANWPPSVVWSANVDRGYGAVAVYDGRLYAVGSDTETYAPDQQAWITQNVDTVYCFNARTGDVLWSNTYFTAHNQYGNMATPTVAGGKVYTFSHENELRIWDRMTGAALADRMFAPGVPSYGACASPLVLGESVIVNAGAFGAAASNVAPCNVIWGNVSGTNPSYASPVPLTVDSIPHVAIVNWKGVLNIIPADGGLSGVPRMTFPLGIGTVYGDPIVLGSRIFVAGSGGAVMLNVAGAPSNVITEVWRKGYLEMQGYYMNSLVVGDYVYGARFAPSTYAQSFTCVNVSDGASRWVHPFSDEGLTPVNGYPVQNSVAIGGHIVVLHDSGMLNIMKASPTGFDVEGRAWIRPFNGDEDPGGEFTAPVVADGLLYCRGARGRLICYQIGPTNALPDNDGDSLPDTWEQQHFLSRFTCVPGEDSDGDGLSNEGEFVAGTQPTNAASALRADISIANGKVLVACESKAATEIEYGSRNRYYTLEQRTNLLSGSWAEVPGFVDVEGDDSTIVHTNSTPESSEFYRVKARLE